MNIRSILTTKKGSYEMNQNNEANLKHGYTFRSATGRYQNFLTINRSINSENLTTGEKHETI